MKLIIFESIKEAKYIISTNHELLLPANEIEIISTFPEIKYLLKQHNHHSLSTSEYININDYQNINFNCLNIFTRIDQDLSEYILHKTTKCSINLFRYFSYYAIYTIIWNLRLLENIFKKKEYETVYTFNQHDTSKTSPWFISDNNILHHLILTFFSNKSFKHLVLNTNKINHTKYVCTLTYNKSIQYFLNLLYCKLLSMVSTNSLNKKKVLVPSMSYNMDSVCSKLMNKYSDILFFKLSLYGTVYGTYLDKWKKFISDIYHIYALIRYLVFGKGIAESTLSKGVVLKLCLTLLANHDDKSKMDFNLKLPKIFFSNTYNKKNNLNSFRNNGIIQFFKQHKLNDIINYIQYQQFLSAGLEHGIGLCRPDLVLSQMSSGFTCALGFITKKESIPSMLISHGSFVKHTKNTPALEHELIANNILFGGYQYLGIQSSLAYKYSYEKQKDSNSIVKINPTIFLHNLQNKINKDEKLTILHASTTKDGTKRYLFETPDELLETLIEIVETMSECSNLKLIIKFREIESFSFNALTALLGPLPDNVTIIRNAPFGDVLAASHLLMSFSSTTIEEALLNNKPVLLYGGKGRYSHIPVLSYRDGETNIMNSVTFVTNKTSLGHYFKILNERFLEFINYPFNFSNYKHDKSISVVQWVNQQKIFD